MGRSRRKMDCRFLFALASAIVFFISPSAAVDDADPHQVTIDGTVAELDLNNFESVISTFDFVLVDFYAPWCGHCKRLSPELDAAAPVLAKLKDPILVAKIDADKYIRFARKYDVDGFPTLKLFMHGVPMDYHGPRKSDLIIRYLKKYVASDVSVLDSDTAINNFIEAAGNYFPIFIGFGLNESLITNLAIKYKKKAWFAAAKDFSEDAMILHDFDKVPALVALQPSYNEQSIFYGPFEESFLEDFIKQNLLPLTLPINYETLKLLKGDERKVLLTIVGDEHDDRSKGLIKLLKAAASANRDLIFAYVGFKQFEDFADTFGIDKKVKLPKMVIWNGDEEYFNVIGSESMDEENQASQITKFLEGYREGRTERKVIGPSLIGFINSLVGMRTVYFIVFAVAITMLIRTISTEDEQPPRRGTTESNQAEDKQD